VHMCVKVSFMWRSIGIVQKELAVDKTHAFGVRDPGSNPL